MFYSIHLISKITELTTLALPYKYPSPKFEP
jgi:hypothetical protein